MNYSYMKVFYTVYKYQNLSKAAIDLNMTQPAVSRIIANIEREFQTRLFIRNKNGVIPTKEGATLFEKIQKPLLELEKIDRDFKDHQDLSQMVVHVGTTATALYCYVLKHINEIKDKFPKIILKFHTGSSSRLLKMVANGEIDFAFITTPFKVNDDIEIHHVAELHNMLLAPISYKDKIPDVLPIKDLNKYPFILLGNEMQFREHVNSFLDEYGVKLDPVYEIDSSGLLASLVESDCGLTFIPEELANKSIASGKSFAVKLDKEIPPRYVTFAIHKGANHSSIIYEIKNEISRNSL